MKNQKINKFHSVFLTKHMIRDAFPDIKLDNKEKMLEELNQKTYDELEDPLNDLLIAGRKKIVILFLDYDKLSDIRSVNKFESYIEENAEFNISEDCNNIFQFKSTIPKGNHLYNIDFIKNSTDNGLLDKVIFSYVSKLEVHYDNEKKIILYPIYVLLDFQNAELSVRVNSKDNLYYIGKDERIKDLDLAIQFLGKFKVQFDDYIELDIDSKGVHNIVFTIYEDFTNIPESYFQDIYSNEGIIENFIKELVENIDILKINRNNNQRLKDDIKNSIKREIIQNLDDSDREDIIEENKGYIVGLDTRNIYDRSKLQQSCGPTQSINLIPSFQSIKNIVDNDSFIDNNKVYWGIDKDTYVRSKVINKGDILIINFEEFVSEEVIENVLSRIRGYKENREV